jgi:hypothetical protein
MAHENYKEELIAVLACNNKKKRLLYKCTIWQKR